MKQKNAIALAYDNATRKSQLLFIAELLRNQELSGINYLRKFRQTWQYEPTIGNIPYTIVETASTYLGFIAMSKKSHLEHN